MTNHANDAADRIMHILRAARHYMPVGSKQALVAEMDKVLGEERERCANHLDGLAAEAQHHGYVDASSHHAAYEQGVRESAETLRKHVRW